MSVDLDAIAHAGRCDVSSLRLALPLLEQGYTPPFLARYRRDELSGVDEASLWALASAIKAEQDLALRREELNAVWEQTALRDPAIGLAIGKAHSMRVLARLSRRLKTETSDAVDDATRLASRILNPQKGDGSEFAEIAAKVEGISDAPAAVAGLDQAIATRLMGDPRIIAAATRWLAKNARIHIESVNDPHGESDEKEVTLKKRGSKRGTAKQASGDPKLKTEASSVPVTEVASTEVASAEVASAEVASAEVASAEVASAEVASAEVASAEVASPEVSSSDVANSDPSIAAAIPDKASTKALQKTKKISPRQRRRRWLVSVLKPLAGKRFRSDKLSAFQIVMLGRALRSQVAKCAFEYDATKLVAEIQNTAVGINRPIEAKLRQLVLEYEANIREAAEAAWWDDLAERATARLIHVTADHLRRQVNRGGVDAKVVMSIDAVGPRTAAAAIVSNDGRLLHSEDVPCQLSSAQRSQAVNKMGELIHNHHVDLIVISNGPARRATMIALGELIKQSPEKSIRWTLADRSGADAYSGSPSADQEMRSTPRRFRAAAWLAFSVLQPAQAITKVDPLKLRLSSFQRELSDQALAETLEDILISGASRGGVDANSAPISWLARLPGMTASIAQSIDQSRRESLFLSRQAIAELDAWESIVQSRQAIPFLRVFGSDQPLDGTLVHPDDYALANKLANSLQIELPPNAPPGHQPQPFDADSDASTPTGLSAVEVPVKPIPVEDFSSQENEPAEFALDQPADQAAPTDQPTAPADQASDPADQSDQSDSTDQSDQSDSTDQSAPSDSAGQEDLAKTASHSLLESIKRPLPENAKIDKLVKEWQVGSNRVKQIVHWLCDPFGDSDVSGNPPAVMSTMPTTNGLKPGDSVIGVVVSVMPFGVFVELAPDCSGLIHVSRVSEAFVEDLHEAVQVGDVISAWVIGIDDKRRRVGLSAISPERARLLDDQRHARSDRGPRGSRTGQRDTGPRGSAQSATAPSGAAPRGTGQRGTAQRGTGQVRTGSRTPSTGNQAATGGNPANQSGGRGKPPARSPQGKSGDARRGKERHAGGRDRGFQGRERKPESYRVESKKDLKPITEEMQKGKEPMRSFGDLIQFFGKDKTTDKTATDAAKPIAARDGDAVETASEQMQVQQPESQRPESHSTEDSAPALTEIIAHETSIDTATSDSSETDESGS